MSPEGVAARPAPTLASWAFRTAYGALSVEAALAMRESRDWRHLPGDDPARFAGLLSGADIDAFLRTDAARQPRLAMADDSRPGSAAVPAEDYTLEDGAVDLPRLLARFDAGASVILSQFDEVHPPLQRLCRGLERVFMHGVQANIYLTPAGAQGFRTHYDSHDVLVLQVEGQKRWRLWDGEPLPRPTRNTPFEEGLAPEGEAHSRVLGPGDALYIPRGVFHDAAAQGEAPSLHITLGFLDPCWAQALRELLESLEATDPALRESVPTWRLGEAGWEAGLGGVMAHLSGPGLAGRLEDMLLAQLAARRQPLPARGLFDRMPEGRLRLAEGMHHHLLRGDDGVDVLRWSGGAEVLTPAQLEDLLAMAEGTIPRDRAFAERLWRHGLLEAAG